MCQKLHRFAEAETWFGLIRRILKIFGLALRTNERVKADMALFYVNIRLIIYIYHVAV